MRVVHVIQNLDPAWGGVPMVASRVAAAHAGLGHNTVIACHPAPAGEQAQHNLLDGLPHRDQLNIHHIRSKGGMAGFVPDDLVTDLDPIIHGADALILHGVWDPILRAASLVATNNSIPYAITPHGMLSPWSLQLKAWKKKLALSLGYRSLISNARFIQALNDDEARYIDSLGYNVPTRIIPNGIFLDEFANLPPNGEYRQHANLSDHPYILFLGRIHPAKGLDLMVDAFRTVITRQPDTRLVLAGPPDEDARRINDLVQKHKLQDHVLIPGPIYGRTKLAALVDCSCFCMTSRQEGFSMAITEALACARPVVITNTCHFPAIASASAGIITERNPAAVANALTSVLDNPDRAKDMGIAGRHLVETNYTWPTIAQQLISAFLQ
ncbi:MAG: glycosyltransferase [Phycisphaeraceae bacterium]